MAELEELEEDAWSQDNIAKMSLIVQLRIYDVLMAILRESNSSYAHTLLELHSTGGLVAASPGFTGEFLTDILNENKP